MKQSNLQRFFAIHLAFLISSDAALAEVSDWKDVSDWNISFYSGGSSCLAYASYNGGTDFFIGLSNLDAKMLFEVTLVDKKWLSLESGKEYTIEVKFGNETPWTLEMDGVSMEDFRGLTFTVDAYSEKAGFFVDEFMRETSMEWIFQGKQLAFLDLSSSRLAFAEVVACAKSYRSASGEMSDPFASSGRSSGGDPFAN